MILAMDESQTPPGELQQQIVILCLIDIDMEAWMHFSSQSTVYEYLHWRLCMGLDA